MQSLGRDAEGVHPDATGELLEAENESASLETEQARMSTRVASQLYILRQSLIDEALRDGKTIPQAEAYATKEIREADLTRKLLRQAVRGCRA